MCKEVVDFFKQWYNDIMGNFEIINSHDEVPAIFDEELTELEDVVVPEYNVSKGKYALLVGIDKYKSSDIPELDGCVYDTEQMWNLLVNQYGFLPDNIRVLTNERATQEEILNRLEWLVRMGDVDENELFYLQSGHGSQVRDRGELDELNDSLDEIIVPYDMDWDNPLTDDMIYAKLKTLNSKSFFTMVCDTCCSGTMTRNIQQPDQKVGTIQLSDGKQKLKYISPPFDIKARSLNRDLPINVFGAKKVDKASISSQNHVLISGCRDDQSSVSVDIGGVWQGALTHFIIKNLKFQPIQTWAELHKIVEYQLEENEFDQEPQLSGNISLINRNVFE